MPRLTIRRGIELAPRVHEISEALLDHYTGNVGSIPAEAMPSTVTAYHKRDTDYLGAVVLWLRHPLGTVKLTALIGADDNAVLFISTQEEEHRQTSSAVAAICGYTEGRGKHAQFVIGPNWLYGYPVSAHASAVIPR
jgi:hypothetical protein